MKSSFPTSESKPSNSRTISKSEASSVVPVCDFVEDLPVLATVAGGREDTEVAGRAWMRLVETDPIRVEAIRPVAVAGRVGGVICCDFLVEPAMGVGATRTACTCFEERGTARRFELTVVTVAARADVPFVTCPTEALRGWAKGVKSSVNVRAW